MTPGMFELKRKAVDTGFPLTSGIHIVQYTVLVLTPDSNPSLDLYNLHKHQCRLQGVIQYGCFYPNMILCPQYDF